MICANCGATDGGHLDKETGIFVCAYCNRASVKADQKGESKLLTLKDLFTISAKNNVKITAGWLSQTNEVVEAKEAAEKELKQEKGKTL
jgi:hypothetical protein